MRIWRLMSMVGAAILLATMALPNQSNPTVAALAEPTPAYEDMVVRVYFDDIETAHKIAISYEPLESNYENGYLVLAVTPEEQKQIIEAGLRVEVDEFLSAHFGHAHTVAANEAATQSIPGFSCYRTVEETFATAQSIVANYPTLATWSDVGDSWEKTQGLGGYDLQVLRLTNTAVPGPKPIIFITSAIHAREYTTAELTTRLAESLVNGYGVDADATWILDYHEVHFMLQANPDGRKQAEAGLLWRKNTNQNYCGATSNNRGADLNRNFPFEWNCCGGSSTNQCNATYHGSGPASEPETQAVVSYIQNNFVDSRGPNINDAAPLNTEGIYLDIHSSGRLLLWPWGFTSNPAPNGTQLQTLGRKLAFFNGHTPQQSIGLYPTDGTTTSFAYGELGLAAFTYELGTEFFESCSYFENTLVPDNIPSLMYALKVVRTPYITPAGPDAVDTALSAGSDPVGIPSGIQIELSASINDTRYNNSNGTEPSQTIAAAEYYLDTPPWNGGTPIAMAAADGTFSASIENATASIDTTGFSQGQHILYVRGQDSSGNWGAVSAIFLYIDDNAPPPPPPPTVIFSDDFENDLGWSANPNGTDTATTGLWERGDPEGTASGGPLQLDSTASGLNALVTGRLAGSSAGTHDIDNGETSIRSPNIALPSSGDLTLSFEYYLAHLNNGTADDYLRVQIVGNTTTTVFEELGSGDNDYASWSNFSTSLNSYAGQTVYLLISAADAGSGSLIEAAVDDILITQTNVGPTPTPTNTPPPTDTPTPTNTPLPTNTPTPTNTPLPPTDTSTPTNTPLPTDTPPPPTNTPIPTDTSTPTNTPPPTDTPTSTNTPLPTNTPTPTNTPEPGGTVIIFTDDFESDLGWSTNPSGTDTATTGQWERGNPEGTDSGGPLQLDTTVSGANNLVTGRLAGTSVGTHDIDNGETSVRSPDIALPSTGDLTLSFEYYLAHLNNATTDDYLRVQVVGNTTTTLFEELGSADSDYAAWSSFSTSLNSYAGQTVYLLISAADAGSASLVEAAVDDILITQTISGPTPIPTNTPPPTNTPIPPTPTNTPEPGGAAVIYVSSSTNGTAGSVSFNDEDILAYDTGSSTWSMYFDGSDVGLNASSSLDTDAFFIQTDGSILISIVGAATIPDVGAIDDSDIVRFVPTSLGTTTAGTFEWYFDGSDVGLTTNGEDIDAISVLSDGRLLLSTSGTYSVTGASGSDEDLVIFDPASLGSTTSGTWVIAFDGSDVGLNNSGSEDTGGTWYDEAAGDIYLTARGSFAVTGVSGDGADIYICSPSSTGTTTSCTFSLFWDGSANGYGGEISDGIHVVP